MSRRKSGRRYRGEKRRTAVIFCPETTCPWRALSQTGMSYSAMDGSAKSKADLENWNAAVTRSNSERRGRAKPFWNDGRWAYRNASFAGAADDAVTRGWNGD